MHVESEPCSAGNQPSSPLKLSGVEEENGEEKMSGIREGERELRLHMPCCFLRPSNRRVWPATMVKIAGTRETKGEIWKK